MALSKFLVFFLFLSFIFSEINSATLSDSEDEVSESEVPDSSLKLELDKLKSKISLAESSIEERTQEIKSKERTIKELEKIIDEKSSNLASLQSEVLSLKEKELSKAKKREDEADVRASQLQEQINNLKKVIEAQNEKKVGLEARANDAESRIKDLNLKLENLHRTNEEQKSRIHKSQRALEVAEEELMKAKLEASSLSKYLSEVHEAWIPPWLSVHFVHFQSFVVTHWHKHGKPTLDLTVNKALKKKSELEKWAQPHVHIVKSRWMPIVKEHCSTFVNNFSLHLRSLTNNAIDLYHISKKSMEPHVVRLQEVSNPYFQEAKKFSKPYVDQVSLLMKPHMDKARVYLKPYTKKVIRSYKRFIKFVTAYHRQVQATVLDLLKNHEHTRPLATNKLTWYMASALMALPVFLVLNMIAEVFSKKPKKRVPTSHSGHTRRRARRGHTERRIEQDN
ncbi:unnamed protein product [Coffea canephora]|uniref:Uncharacterized protein n=1 Tax=Coffea canephora TaxID=49390 RepID=A0A068V543_COFCA|nr:unnamed protein product [Coffea canephora]